MINSTNIGLALRKAGEEIFATVTNVTDGVNNAIQDAKDFLASIHLQTPHQNDHELPEIETHQLTLATRGKIPRELLEKIIKYSAQITRARSDTKQKENQKDFAESFFTEVSTSIRLMIEEGTSLSPHIRAFLAKAQDFTSERPVTPKLQADLDALANAMDNGNDDDCRFRLLEVRRTMLITKEDLPESFRFGTNWIEISGRHESMLLTHEQDRKDRL